MEARYYTKHNYLKVKCHLCPHECIIRNGSSGMCKVRENRNGVLIAASYQVISALAVDPIEKKPLYHFHPGKNILSLGSYGCNFKCACCQNHEIAQNAIPEQEKANCFSSGEIISKAKQTENNIGIAFTYNEPGVNYEFVLETAKLAKRNRQHTVLVTNGYLNPEPFNQLIPFIDALNIDLKTYAPTTYHSYYGGNLESVFATIETSLKHKKHVELTYLLIHELNDDVLQFKKLTKRIANTFGKNIVLHISKAFPRYLSNVKSTPDKKLHEFYKTAKLHLNFVYLGNINDENYSKTTCPYCSSVLIERTFFNVELKNIDTEGKCNSCCKQIVNFV